MMKKAISLIFLMTLCVSLSEAQITFEFEHDSGVYSPVKLSASGWKYVDSDRVDSDRELRLMNLDGSLYKDLTLPPPISDNYISNVWYISETLFDTDSTNIEYLIAYIILDETGGFKDYAIQVANEFGTVLFEEWQATTFETFSTGRYYYSIYSTDEGAKMQLLYADADGYLGITKVFGLAGDYPTGVGIAPDTPSNEPTFTIYPNPNDGLATLEFKSVITDDNAHLHIYDSKGSLMKNIPLAKGLTSYNLDNSELPTGIYYFQTYINGQLSPLTKKVVVN